MIKSALEKVISEDMAEIWTILEPDEKRKIIDSFVIHNYKKNQIQNLNLKHQNKLVLLKKKKYQILLFNIQLLKMLIQKHFYQILYKLDLVVHQLFSRLKWPLTIK